MGMFRTIDDLFFLFITFVGVVHIGLLFKHSSE